MTMSGYEYRCSGGETFDSIALDVYGDERYAADLMTANPSLAEKMFFLGGERLDIPLVAAGRNEQTGRMIAAAPWKGVGT